MANEPKAVSPAVAAIVIIVAVVVIGLVGWYFMRPKTVKMTPEMMNAMKSKMGMPPVPYGAKGMKGMKGMKGGPGGYGGYGAKGGGQY